MEIREWGSGARARGNPWTSSGCRGEGGSPGSGRVPFAFHGPWRTFWKRILIFILCIQAVLPGPTVRATDGLQTARRRGRLQTDGLQLSTIWVGCARATCSALIRICKRPRPRIRGSRRDMNLSLYLSISLSLYLSISLSLYLSIFLCFYVSMSLCLYVSMSHLSLYVYIHI